MFNQISRISNHSIKLGRQSIINHPFLKSNLNNTNFIQKRFGSSFQPGVTITSQYSWDTLHDPLLNKGTSFTMVERDRLGLRGLLPPSVKNLETQMLRIRGRYDKLENDLDRYLFMQQIQDTNETLFYKFLVTYIEELAPIVYTPTVGLACLNFTHAFRRARGMYFSAADRGEMKAMIHNFPSKEVDLVVLTDGGRVLGLGDLGCNGMPISIGKLSLYVAAAGLHPGRVLPVLVDVGTNNEKFIHDPFYLGLPQKRLDGVEYFEVLDEVLDAITSRWPNVLIQFEDITPDKANILLNKYRNQILCFNDDIQGTGTVIVSGLFNALRASNQRFSDITKQRILIAGAGCAGIGVADSIKRTMMREGLLEREALQRFYICDKDGLITNKRKNITPYQAPYANSRTDCPEGLSLLETIHLVKPTILLGISGVGSLFTEEIVKAMSEYNQTPIIFPISNPTSNCECTAEDAIKWSNGRAIFASGSPYAPVRYNLKSYYISQANNMFIFPGLGFGSVISGASTITDNMLHAASVALANTVGTEEIKQGYIYPRVKDIRNSTTEVALAVIKQAISEDNYTVKKLKHMTDDELRLFIKKKSWLPAYQSIVPNHGTFH